MAKFHRSENGSPWLEITWLELMDYSDNPYPICDECLESLIGCESIALVPILNEAFCPKCREARLKRLRRYPEDCAIEERRTQFYLGYFGVREEG